LLVSTLVGGNVRFNAFGESSFRDKGKKIFMKAYVMKKRTYETAKGESIKTDRLNEKRI